MLKVCATLLLLSIFCPACSRPDAFFPVSEGNVWVYRTPLGELTRRIEKVHPTEAGDQVTFAWGRGGQVVYRENYLVTERAVLLISNQFTQVGHRSFYEPPLPIMKKGAGDKHEWIWKGDLVVADQKLQAFARFTVAPARVEIMGGNRRVREITQELVILQGAERPELTQRYYYDPVYGLVRLEGPEGGGGTLTGDLVDFRREKGRG